MYLDTDTDTFVMSEKVSGLVDIPQMNSYAVKLYPLTYKQIISLKIEQMLKLI